MPAARAPRPHSDAIVAQFVLPVSGVAVALRQPTGAEDLLLTEHRIDDPALALALAERLGRTDPALDWAELPVSDIDTLIVRLRQAIIGNRVIAEVTCANASCGQRVDLPIGIDAYLAHHRPHRGGRRGWSAESSTDTPGWFVLRAAAAGRISARKTQRTRKTKRTGDDVAAGADAVRFRLPTLADQIAVYGLPDIVVALAARCIRPGTLSGQTRARVEAAMAALAPPLAGPLQGPCPHCAIPIAAQFEARLYCLQELRDRARFIFDDIDALAERYHWSERAILTLPHLRRTSYVERARRASLG
jgi:hypothetical protein